MNQTLVAVVLVAGFAIAHSSDGFAQTQPAVWTYAYITVADGVTEIAYAEGRGCRLERVEIPATGRLDPAGKRFVVSLIAMAVRELGEGGWELIGPSPAYCHTNGTDTIHFKRRR